MKTTSAFRAGLGIAGVLAAALGLSGCLGPTYGTDKPAMAQFGDDLTSSVSLGLGKDQSKANMKYNPRPKLVVAANKQGGTLPEPQQSMTDRANNPNWVESPEETRNRLRQEADAHRNDPSYRSPLNAGNGQGGQMTETQKWEAFRQAKQNAETVDVTARRRSLVDPPSEFRSTDAANLTDLGEPEDKKEKRRKQAAVDARSGSDWWKIF